MNITQRTEKYKLKNKTALYEYYKQIYPINCTLCKHSIDKLK